MTAYDRELDAAVLQVFATELSHILGWETPFHGIGPVVPERRYYDHYRCSPVPIWVTAHRELRTSRRIRVVFDLLAEALAGE